MGRAEKAEERKRQKGGRAEKRKRLPIHREGGR
jgi:hypothetical protein